jgi:flagellin
MAMNINTNVGALMASAAANSVNKSMEQSMERLSTGLRINSAADDAAGSAITSRLTAEIKGTNQAIRNAMDSQAMIETAEGAHIEVEAILQRMRELAVQAANDTNGDADRANLQLEISQLSSEIDRIAETTTWAGVNLLKGSDTSNSAEFSFQIGSSGGAGESVTQAINSITSAQLGVTGNAVAPAVSSNYVAVSGEGTLETEGNKISFGGKFNAGDTYAVTIGDNAMSITATTGDGYTDDAAGLAAQMADVIRATAITGTKQAEGLTVVDNGDGSISVFAEPVITNVKTEEASGAVDNQTFTFNSADKTFTVGGTHENTDIYKLTINGDDIALTTAATKGFEQNNAGVVAELVSTINAEAEPKAGGIRAFVDSDDPTKFRLTQEVLFSAVTYTPKTSTVTPTLVGAESSGASTLTFANTPSIGDKFTTTVNGVKVDIEIAANDGFDRTARGAALKMEAALQAKIDSGELKGVTVATGASNSVVTVTQGHATSTINTPNIIDVSSAGLITEYASGVFKFDTAAIDAGGSAVGTLANGDTASVSINGVDITVTTSTSDGFNDDTDGLVFQLTQAINDNAELKAQGITAAATKGAAGSASSKVTLSFTPQLEETEFVKADDLTAVKNAADMSTTLTVNRSSFAHGDVLSVDVDGEKVDVSIDTTDSAVDNTAGVAAQIKAAIDAKGMNGVTVTDNGDGSILIAKPSAANVTSAAAATKTIEVIDAAFVTLNTQRSSLGAISNRLDSTVSNLTNVVTNLESGRARIQDADFAAESTNLAKQQILQQAATSMLAQANASKQSVLSLLQG